MAFKSCLKFPSLSNGAFKTIALSPESGFLPRVWCSLVTFTYLSVLFVRIPTSSQTFISAGSFSIITRAMIRRQCLLSKPPHCLELLDVQHEKSSLCQLSLGFFPFLHDRESRYFCNLRVILCFAI